MTQTPALDANGQPIFEVQLQAMSEAAAGNGVASPSALEPTAGTADLDVDVAAGDVVYNDTTTSFTATTVTLSAGDTEDRWDIIVADTAAGAVTVREGTAAQYPTPPALGSDDVLIAVVFVEASATQIAGSDILSWRLQGGQGVIDALDGGTTVVNGITALNALSQLTITQDGKQADLAVAADGIDTAELASGAVTDTEVASSTAISRDKLQGQWQTVTKTSDYTAANYEHVLADASSAALTVTLPTPASDLRLSVKKIDATNNVTIATPNSETIDGSSSITLSSQYSERTITSDGTNYFIV